MTQHHERLVVPFTPQKMYDLVLDIGTYPRFIPFIEAMRVTRDKTGPDGVRFMTADMVVRYTVFRETFRSEVTADPEAKTIRAEYIKGPLKDLSNLWTFEPDEKGCCVDFRLDFAFKNRLMQAAAQKFVDHGFKRMSGAFIKEAHRRYAPLSA